MQSCSDKMLRAMVGPLRFVGVGSALHTRAEGTSSISDLLRYGLPWWLIGKELACKQEVGLSVTLVLRMQKLIGGSTLIPNSDHL